MSNTVLVTGATGKTGRRLVPLLAGRGDTVRAATRHPGTTIQDAQTVLFDWRHPGTYAPALDGVHAAELTISSAGGDFMATVTDHVRAVTGRAPTTFAGYARTAAPAWRRRASLAPDRTAS